MKWIKDKHGELSIELADHVLDGDKGEEVFFDTEPHGGNYASPKNVGGHADVIFDPKGSAEVVPGGTRQSPAEAKLYRDAKDEGYKIKTPVGICKKCGKEFARDTTRQKYCSKVCARKAQNERAATKRKEKTK